METKDDLTYTERLILRLLACACSPGT